MGRRKLVHPQADGARSEKRTPRVRRIGVLTKVIESAEPIDFDPWAVRYLTFANLSPVRRVGEIRA